MVAKIRWKVEVKVERTTARPASAGMDQEGGKFVYADGTGQEEEALEDLFKGLYNK